MTHARIPMVILLLPIYRIKQIDTQAIIDSMIITHDIIDLTSSFVYETMSFLPLQSSKKF